jgi:hypothetical protein
VALKTNSEADIVLIVGTDVDIDRLTAAAPDTISQTP